jgi:hypothetical protein
MTKIQISIALTCLVLLAGAFLVAQADTDTNSTYYSNNFESPTALDDGYWSVHDAAVQTVNDAGVLEVAGEATFIPQQGNYALDNFTVQYDVWHNIVYENNTMYQGPFYEGSDMEGNVIVRMGYVQRGTDGNLEQTGFVSFAAGPDGATYSHYYFQFDHSSDWSTWRLTVVTTQTDGGYYANVTVQVNEEVITEFNTGLPNPDGMGGELIVPDIKNEPLYSPVAYHNLLPLPQAGAPVPTYVPTAAYSSEDIHYNPLSNIQAKPVYNNNGATPSYIDNFYYGYANAVPTEGTPHPTENTGAQPQQYEFPTTTVVAATLMFVAAAVGIALYQRKTKQKPTAT